MLRHLTIVLASLAALPCLTAPAAAQEPATPDTLPVVVRDTLPPTSEIPREGPVPRNAFIRGLLVPGWGHFGMGEVRRGTVYAALQGTSWVMLGTSMNRLGDIRDQERELTALGRDSLLAEMAADTALARQLEDPDAFEQALLQYPGLNDARTLERARRRHRQDWIVYTVVLTFAGAIDAYVTAHLREFPAEITATPSRDGGATFALRVPVGARR